MNKETRFSKVFLITVIVIGIIFYIYFLRTGKKPAPAPAPAPAPSDIGEEKLPTISMSAAIEKPTSVEEYGMMTEYYNTDDLAELSATVRIKLTLNIEKAFLIDRITIKRTNGTRIVEKTIENTTIDPLITGPNVIYLNPESGENMIGTHYIQVSYYTFFYKDIERLGPEGRVEITTESISLLIVSGNSINLDTKYSSIGNYTENYLEIKSVDSGGNIFEGSDVYFKRDGTDGGFNIMGSGNNDNVKDRKFFLINIDGTNWKFQTIANGSEVYMIRDNSGVINITSDQGKIKSKLFTIKKLASIPACISTVEVVKNLNCDLSGVGDGIALGGDKTTTTYPKSPNCDNNNLMSLGFIEQPNGTFKKEEITPCCIPTGVKGQYGDCLWDSPLNGYYQKRYDPVSYSHFWTGAFGVPKPISSLTPCNELASKYPSSMLVPGESAQNFDARNYNETSFIVVKRSCTAPTTPPPDPPPPPPPPPPPTSSTAYPCSGAECRWHYGAPSSLRLKDNIIKIGEIDGITVYSWTWNAIAMSTYGLKGREVGIIAENLPSDVVTTDVYGYMNIRKGTWASKLVEKIRDIYPK